MNKKKVDFQWLDNHLFFFDSLFYKICNVLITFTKKECKHLLKQLSTNDFNFLLSNKYTLINTNQVKVFWFFLEIIIFISATKTKSVDFQFQNQNLKLEKFINSQCSKNQKVNDLVVSICDFYEKAFSEIKIKNPELSQREIEKGLLNYIIRKMDLVDSLIPLLFN